MFLGNWVVRHNVIHRPILFYKPKTNVATLSMLAIYLWFDRGQESNGIHRKSIRKFITEPRKLLYIFLPKLGTFHIIPFLLVLCLLFEACCFFDSSISSPTDLGNNNANITFVTSQHSRRGKNSIFKCKKTTKFVISKKYFCQGIFLSKYCACLFNPRGKFHGNGQRFKAPNGSWQNLLWKTFYLSLSTSLYIYNKLCELWNVFNF